MVSSRAVDSKYYTKRQKVIRDLVHEYIHLTAFENSLIDTAYFQRLRDVKQLTATYVFPNANHTRFEHSLGTFELTRQAIEAVKDNGLFLFEDSKNSIHLIWEFSTLVAALLHDIGHCPFSHLGEKQFDEDQLSERLELALINAKIEMSAKKLSKQGASHEKLSCLVIIEKLWDKLKDDNYHAGNDDNTTSLDLEHICRCILGVRYDHIEELPEYATQCDEDTRIANFRIGNFLIELVNSKVFDMDSLDYIMRDAMYCGLSNTKLDTQRLFSNMSISTNGYPIFKRQAISVLKDIIDQKNNIYLYAVNHHAAIYSNFMHEFMFRRFKNDGLYDMNLFFSPDAIINDLVSDCDVLAVLKQKDREFLDKIRSGVFHGGLHEERVVKRAHDLLTRIFSRNFLKPFWKDFIEFEEFRIRHFKDKKEVFKRICDSVCKGSSAESLRSGVIPAIVRVANWINDQKSCLMPQKLEQHELFLVEVQQKWLDKANINELSVYLRNNEVRNPTRFGGKTPYEYIVKPLTEVLPLSSYSEHYPLRGFYIYVKPINTTNPKIERKYYDNLELVIVISLTYFADDPKGKVAKLLSASGTEKDTLLNEIHADLCEIVKIELQIDC